MIAYTAYIKAQIEAWMLISSSVSIAATSLICIPCKLLPPTHADTDTRPTATWLIHIHSDSCFHNGHNALSHFLEDFNNYRLITAYLLLRVNLDKIMHARWDFDASSARTRRVSALDKHQNWSASALFCLNSRAQSKYAVVNLIHTRRKQTFLSLLCDK